MKKLVLVIGIMACITTFGAKEAYAQMVNLDTAINGAVEEFSYNFKKDSRVAIVAIRSSSARMSKYIIEEMTSVFVNQRLITIVGRAQLDQLQDELRFQMYGEVGDSLAQTVGKRVGAQSVITGSFEAVGNYYRFRIRIIEVNTAAILATYSANVQNDTVVASLMGSSGINPSTSTATASQANNNDFTAGQRWGTWALNAFVLPGLGSYVIMKDKKGGTTQVILGASSIVFYVAGYITILNSSYTEQVPYTYYDSYYPYSSHTEYITQNKIDEGKMSAGSTCVVIGFLLNAANGIFNIVRSASYRKPLETTSVFDNSTFNIALLPTSNGNIDKVRLSYTLHY